MVRRTGLTFEEARSHANIDTTKIPMTFPFENLQKTKERHTLVRVDSETGEQEVFTCNDDNLKYFVQKTVVLNLKDALFVDGEVVHSGLFNLNHCKALQTALNLN